KGVWRAFEDALKTLEATRAKMSTLHAIHKQKQFLFVAKTAQSEQILRGGGCYTAFALDSFNHDRDGRGRNGLGHGIEIVVRHLAESRHDWFEAFFHFLLTGRGDTSERAAVKGIDGGQNFESAFIMAEFSGQLEQSFVDLDTAIAEEAF